MTPAPRTAPLRLAALALLGLSLVLSACSSDAEPKQETKAADRTPSPSATTSTPPPPPEPSRLSGRMGKPNGPVYAVKIDNTGKAHPQAGLSKADVVYVEQVEGGVTRLAAIYSSAYPKYVGPVRSGRITDIELLKQYGTVGLIYSGSQNRLHDNLQRADLKLVSFDQDHSGYTRSGARPQPYDVIGTFDQLRKRAGKVDKPPEMGYTFGAAPGRRQEGQGLHGQLPRGPRQRRLGGEAEALAGVDGRLAVPGGRGRPARPDHVHRAVRDRPAVEVPRRQRRQHAGDRDRRQGPRADLP